MGIPAKHNTAMLVTDVQLVVRGAVPRRTVSHKKFDLSTNDKVAQAFVMLGCIAVSTPPLHCGANETVRQTNSTTN